MDKILQQKLKNYAGNIRLIASGGELDDLDKVRRRSAACEREAKHLRDALGAGNDKAIIWALSHRAEVACALSCLNGVRTIREAAGAYAVSPSTVRRWMDKYQGVE